MFVVVNPRWFYVCSLLLLFANGAQAAGGRYQLTEDGKTLVWNNRPRAEDAASWSGDRDAKGYATGHGTLTWYLTERKIVIGSRLPTTKHIPVTSYSGKMVHGKLEGRVVNVDANGKTFHGTFANGRKTRDWARGRAPIPDRTDIASDQSRDESIRRAELVEAAEAKPQPPAEGPSPIVEAPTSKLPHSTAEIPAEGPAEAQKSASGPERPTARREVRSQSSEVPGPATAETGPGMDNSLRSLAAPPASLRVNLPVESPAGEATPNQVTAPAVVPSLTATEVIGLADAEARRQGYNVSAYQRSQADYTAADETWSVSYDQTNAEGASKHFSVSVEDKTKKASITAGR